MKSYTNLSQLITEQTEDAKFKIEGRPEDNLLNGLVLKRFAYSYTYPKESTSIITPKSILDYITNSTDGDASQIKTVINSLSSPQAVGISADPSNKAGLFGGKNRVEGHVYLFKNVTDSAVTSVNPDQLLGKTGSNNITAFQVLSTPRSGGESIQQNLSKIISAAGKSTTSSSNTNTNSKSAGNNLTMMELNVIMPKLGPGGKENGASFYFKTIVNGLFKNSTAANALIKDPVKVSIKTRSFAKGDSSIFISESDSKIIEAGFTVRGLGISPNTTVTKKADPANGEVEIFISNQTYSKQDLPTIGFYNNYIFPESDSPVMTVISKFFSIQSPLNRIVSSQVDSYTPEIKTALAEILNKSGDPDYKVDSSYNLDELTKSQLVSIMSVWLIYAVNNGVIPISEIETDTYPTIKNYVDILLKGASSASSQSGQPQPSAMTQATNASVKQKNMNRLAGRPTIENEEELAEILQGVGYTKNDIYVNGKMIPNFETALVSAAGDSYKNTSAWKQTDATGNIVLEFDTSEIGTFNPDGTAKIFTPDYKGIHSALGFLRLFLSYKQTQAPIAGQPTLNKVPTATEILTASKRVTGGQKGPNAADVAAVRAGFAWDADLEQAITFYRKKYYGL